MSLFGDFGRKFIDARTRQAERHVSSVLLGMDDETIRKAGYTRSELKRKAGGAHYL